MGEKDDLQLKDLEKGTDLEDTTEKSPLKEVEGGDGEETKEGIQENGGIKELKPNPLMDTLKDPKMRLVVVLLAGILGLLICGVLVVICVLVSNQPEPEVWIEDPIPRMLRLVPTPNAFKNMIRFTSGYDPTVRTWPNLTDEIDNLFYVYSQESNPNRSVTSCESRTTPPSDERTTCIFDTTEFQKVCNKQNHYGYADGSPCIFIQFNHVKNFTPETYTKQDLDDPTLPDGLRNSYLFKGPWVECKGNEPVDVESAGKIKVFPSHELPRFSFPYKGHPDYMAPFVAIRLEKPVKHMSFGITCRLWARNIVFNATSSGMNDTLVDDVLSPSAILPFNVFIN